MVVLRFHRDRRGYEYFSLVDPDSGRRAKGGRLLYWFRTPPNVKLGRLPFDDDAQHALEARYPDVRFDWRRILATPVPSADDEMWRERRRAAKAAKLVAATEDAQDAEDAEDAEDAADPGDPGATADAAILMIPGPPPPGVPENGENGAVLPEEPAELDAQASKEEPVPVSDTAALPGANPHRHRRRRRRGGSGGRQPGPQGGL